MIKNELQKLHKTSTDLRSIVEEIDVQEALNSAYDSKEARRNARGRGEQEYRAGFIYYDIMNKFGDDVIYADNEVYCFNGVFYKKEENAEDILGDVIQQKLVSEGVKKNDIVSDDTVLAGKAINQVIDKLRRKATNLHKNTSSETLINVNNGVIKINEKNVELLNHDRKYVFKYCLDYDYKKDFDFDSNPETCRYFKNFLKTSLPDKQSQLVLQEYMGTVIAGKTIPATQRCMILLGDGENGKSVFADVMEALLGTENVSSVSLNKICDRTGYYVGDIVGKILNYNSELRSIGSEDTFKALVAREKITGRYPHEKPFTTDNVPPLMFACNKLPKIYENSHGVFRRFLIIPFDQKISEEQKIKGLDQFIIKNELPFVLQWCIEGLQRYMKQGQKFTYCKRSEDAKNEYRSMNCSVLQFIEEREFVPDTQYNYTYKNLWEDYIAFCNESGIIKDRLSKRGLSNRLKILGYNSRKASGGVMKYAITVRDIQQKEQLKQDEENKDWMFGNKGQDDLPF